jgi:uncharacterized protein YigA (DUF484 family)
MDELSLIVEGIINKVKKLTVRNKQLKDRIFELENENARLVEELESQAARNDQLEQRIGAVQTAGLLDAEDSFQAKQKVNELLREIEKCYSLLNR